MDFDLSNEQQLLKESISGLLTKNYSFDARKKFMATEKGYSQELWAQYAELGLLGLPFSEEDGGFGGGAVETMIVMEELGKVLALEPYFASVILSGGLLKGASTAIKEQYLPSLIDGSKVFAFASTERQSRYDLGNVETKASHKGGHYSLTGEKNVVLSGDFADHILVSAKLDKKVALFMIDTNAKGVARRGYQTQDGGRGCELSLEKVEAQLIMADALSHIKATVDSAIAALCAEAIGTFDVSLALTVEYLKTRKQFGTTIGSFQSLQHKASEMYVACELSRSMAFYAAMMSGESDAKERSNAISSAKVQIGRASKFIGQSAIQLHGGLGMTQEMSISHYFKRMTVIDTLFGDADYHLAKVAS